MVIKTVKRGSTSVILRVMLRRFNAGGNSFNGLTGLAFNSAGLIIGTICQNEATTTTYTQAAGNIEDITTLGTYAAPTASKCRFKEVDATNHPGLYEIQIADARFNVASSTVLAITVSGAANLQDGFYEVELVSFDPQDTVRLGLTALPNAAAGANTGLPVVGTQVPNATAGAVNGLPTVDANNAVKLQSGTGANQISLSAGLVRMSAAGVQDVWDFLLTGILVVGSIGKKLKDLALGTDNRVLISADAHSGGVTIAAVTGGVTVTTNNDKTNYTLSAAALTALENQVWNALLASHNTANTFGAKLNTLVDPLGVAVPGAYGAGTVGNIIGNRLDTNVGSRSTLSIANVTTGVDASLDAVDAELAAMPADTTTLRSRLKYVYQYFRHKRTCTNALETSFKADSVTPLGTDAVSNDGTTFTKGKMT